MHENVEITKNAITTIYSTDTHKLDLRDVVLQALGFCYCDLTCSGSIMSCTRRCIRVSDGDKYANAFLSSDFWEKEGNPETIPENAIFQLREYHLSELNQGRRLFLIFRMEVLVDFPTIQQVGSPTSIDPYPELKWYKEDEFDVFLCRVDIISQLQEQLRVRRLAPKKILDEAISDTKFSEQQAVHWRNGSEILEQSIAFFKKFRHTPDEMVTPYMSLMSENGRKFIHHETIEKCYHGEELESPRYIQIVDFRVIVDKKKEEYLHALINDGIQMTTVMICPYHLHKKSPYRGPRGIRKFCLVQVQKYSCMTVSNKRKVIMFHEFKGKILEYDSVIRYRKFYPPYVEEAQYTNDPLLHNIKNFVEVMEREGISEYGRRTERRTEPPKPFKVKTKATSHNTLPSAESVISVGAIEKLCLGEEVKSPILQILLFKKIIHMSTERYSLLLSDGYDIMICMIDPELMKTVVKSTFQPFTVLQILKYEFINILRNRRLLSLLKIGYHIPVNKDTKKAIGNPTFYACDIQHSPEVLEAMPKFSPYQTVATITTQKELKKKLEERMYNARLVEMNNGKESSAGQGEGSPDGSGNLTPIYGPNKRVPALDGFCKFADRWHEKFPSPTTLPDGRVIPEKPLTLRLPFQTSHTLAANNQKKMFTKVVFK